MRQLSKDEIQKAVLGGLLFMLLIYGYFTMLLGPLKSGQERTRKQTAEVLPKINEAHTQIRRTSNLETTAQGAATTVKQVGALMTDGSPVAWYPPRVAELFKREGVDKAATRLQAESPAEGDLSQYRQITWDVELRRAQFLPLALAIAAYENEEPLSEISKISIDTDRENPEFHRTLLVVKHLVK